jgi:hypothetical protein
MANVLPPVPYKIPMAEDTGTVTAAWSAWFREIMESVKASLNHGHMYTNANQTITISAVDTATEVPGGMTTGEVKNVTFGGSHYLAVDQAGKYEVNWTMSLSFALAPGGVRNFEAGVMIDGTAQAKGRSKITMPNSTDTMAASGTAVLDLAKNEQISLYVENKTNGDDIDLDGANVSISQVGR